LRCIYHQDQIQERYEKWRSAREWTHLPAKEWRRIEYADTYAGYTPIKQALIDEKLVDQGTGSTFQALEKRGYITVAWISPRNTTVHIWLTAKGRKLVRDSLDIQTPKALKTGQLREWHWRALCRAYACGAFGMSYDQDTGDGYGYVSWKT